MTRSYSIIKPVGVSTVLVLFSMAFLPRSGGDGLEISAPKLHLSEYGFFNGRLADLTPVANVFPYEVNAPLFSDYAEKVRFIYLPVGTRMTYSDSLAFHFPDGAVLIKNFYYPHDMTQPEQGRRILETRLLVKEAKGWKALEYLWNDQQTDANLEVAGAAFPVEWRDGSGRMQSIQYVAPNLNQCKGCHSYDGAFVPLGANMRQLNQGDTIENQLLVWQKQGKLDLPQGFQPAAASRLAVYRQWTHESPSATGFARAYLDANCGHCHNPHGPASTSGMFLDFAENEPEHLGIGKAPVAAGRGSGNRLFGIVPGKPNESILLYRMENGDPGIRMPELGRQLPHKEGLELVRSWIKEMK